MGGVGGVYTSLFVAMFVLSCGVNDLSANVPQHDALNDSRRALLGWLCISAGDGGLGASPGRHPSFWLSSMFWLKAPYRGGTR